MAGKAKWLRSAGWCILGASALNGTLVFLFFDGTNFLTHAAGSWERQRREECQSRFEASLRGEKGRMEAFREREEKRYAAKADGLAREYRHLDTLMGRSDVLLRHPMPRDRIADRIRTENPFKITGRTLSLCFRSGCVYSENIPDYLERERPGGDAERVSGRSNSAASLLGGRDRKPDSLIRVLARESGPFQLWELYRAPDDSTVEYLANYLVHTAEGRLLRRDTHLGLEGVSLGRASASGEYAVLDYGCCPGKRTLGILHRSGKEILKRDYIGRLEWKGDTLVFFAPPGRAAAVGKTVAGGDSSRGDKAAGGDCPYPGETLRASEKTLFAGGKIIPTGATRLFCSD